MQIDSDPTNRRDTVLNWKRSNSLSFFNSVEVIKQNIIIKLFEDYLLKQMKKNFYCSYLSVKFNNAIVRQLQILFLFFRVYSMRHSMSVANESTCSWSVECV